MGLRLFAGLVMVLLAIGVGFLAFTPTLGERKPDLVWGQRGVQDGKFNRPRAAVIDHNDRLFIVDFTARIQGFDLDGHHLGATWTTPDFRNGRPSGLGVDNDGNLLVADSHYHCVRVYDHTGKELKVLGGKAGKNPGEWGYVSDCVQAPDGCYFISEFGENDRVTKLDPAGKFLKCWGENGQLPGQFSRVRALAIGPDGLLYTADACNHRIQVFDQEGNFVRSFGEAGSALGQLEYPYDLCFNANSELYVVERGNMRVQKFNLNGESLGSWGVPGKGPGQLADPWAVVVDRQGRVHVIDTENHRVQRVKF